MGLAYYVNLPGCFHYVEAMEGKPTFRQLDSQSYEILKGNKRLLQICFGIPTKSNKYPLTYLESIFMMFSNINIEH